MNYWIIRKRDGNLAVNRIFDSREDCIYDMINAHPQHYDFDTLDWDNYCDLVELEVA